MLKMAVEIAGNGSDIHKWAALEKTQVFPVRPMLNLVFIRATVAILLAGIGISVQWLLSGFKFF